MGALTAFPNPVNEKVARTVAAGVLVPSIVMLASSAWWIAAVLACSFAARVLTGPTLSPLGQLATRVIAPRLGAPKPVPGPPKRSAQAIGLAFTTAIALVALVAPDHTAAAALTDVMILAAALESIFAICLGCEVFALMMGLGLVPRSVCGDCAGISRLRRATGGA